jgi:hypothetical protein
VRDARGTRRAEWKPALYAAAGIRHCWQVELGDAPAGARPAVLASILDGTTYRLGTTH